MIPFNNVVSRDREVTLKTFDGVKPEEWHNIQTVEINVQLLVRDAMWKEIPR